MDQGVCSQIISFDPVKAKRNEVLNRILELLVESGISQKEFAHMLQIRPQTITDWRTGKSSSFLKKLSPIASCLNTTPIWLYYGEGLNVTIAE